MQTIHTIFYLQKVETYCEPFNVRQLINKLDQIARTAHRWFVISGARNYDDFNKVDSILKTNILKRTSNMKEMEFWCINLYMAEAVTAYTSQCLKQRATNYQLFKHILGHGNIVNIKLLQTLESLKCWWWY